MGRYKFIAGIIVFLFLTLFGFFLFSDNDVMFSSNINYEIGPFGSDYSLRDECYISGVDFPDSPLVPKLPPLNPNPYLDGENECGDFAFTFCEESKDITEIIECNLLRFDWHWINLIVYKEGNGEIWFCIVEPQTNDFYCMPFEEFKKLDFEDWVKKTLCREYYGFDDEKCKEDVFNLPLCNDVAGKACSSNQKGEIMSCMDKNNEGRPIISGVECKCTGSLFKKCKWAKI